MPLKILKTKKTPKITDNEWNDLASTYREGALEIEEALLPTDFDKEKYAVSMDELKNCDLKEQNLRKLNDYLKELKNAQEQGKQSITIANSVSAKIKISRELLRYCIDVHEKLGQLPIFGEKFLWDWVALQTDVTDALNVFEEAIKNQRKKIIAEKSKLDLYIPNLEANLFHITMYLNENCRPDIAQKKPLTNNKKTETETPTAKEESHIKEKNKSTANHYFFLTTQINIDNKLTDIISKPIPYDGNPNDIFTEDKDDFIAQIKLQIPNQAGLKNEKLKSNIKVHYGNPFSTLLLSSTNDTYEAIDAYKKSTLEAVDGIGEINFLQLN